MAVAFHQSSTHSLFNMTTTGAPKKATAHCPRTPNPEPHFFSCVSRISWLKKHHQEKTLIESSVSSEQSVVKHPATAPFHSASKSCKTTRPHVKKNKLPPITHYFCSLVVEERMAAKNPRGQIARVGLAGGVGGDVEVLCDTYAVFSSAR
jgi:hypothetical protein